MLRLLQLGSEGLDLLEELTLSVEQHHEGAARAAFRRLGRIVEVSNRLAKAIGLSDCVARFPAPGVNTSPS